MSSWVETRCCNCGNIRLFSLDRSEPDEEPCACRPLCEQVVLPIGDVDG